MVAQARRRQKPPLRAAKGTRSAANAGDARGGDIPSPSPVPSFPQATVIPASHRHSRKPPSFPGGNPEKNKSRRLPSPSQSEGDAEDAHPGQPLPRPFPATGRFNGRNDHTERPTRGPRHSRIDAFRRHTIYQIHGI